MPHTEIVPGGDEHWYDTEPDPAPTYEELQTQLARERKRAADAERALQDYATERLHEHLNP